MKERKMKHPAEQGQALITLLFFVIIASTITSAAIVMVLISSYSGARLQQGMTAYTIAQSGTENAMLRLMRNPSYTGEVLAVGQGTATIQVTGAGTSGNPYIIVSKGTLGNFVKKLQVSATYSNNLFVPSKPQEIY